MSGKTGTVFYDVVVPDFSKDPLMMSGLLLSSLPGRTSPDVLTPQRDPVAEKLLGAPRDEPPRRSARPKRWRG